QNRKYGYRFGYPRGSRLVNMDDAVQNILYSRSVYVYDAHDKFLFGIDALDPEPLRSYPGFQETIKRYEWPLSSFADFIEKQNSLKNNPVTTTEMIGKTVAYEFWFDGSFHNGDASQILEPPRQAFFYVKPSRVILQIRFPAGFEPSEEIFASLELTDER
ncbi:MAG: hypothetical protein Q8R07_00870, partial [Candidatus Uhrbacteria bacterium]|nr:hypothetical protein [Candidatus Uhrbacteria bacterium]